MCWSFVPLISCVVIELYYKRIQKVMVILVVVVVVVIVVVVVTVVVVVVVVVTITNKFIMRIWIYQLNWCDEVLTNIYKI